MKAVVREKYGGPDVLALREVEKPAPGDDEVLVRVHAASVNDWDWGLLQGDLVNRLMFGLLTPKKRTLGSDVAGRVEAVGRKATRFQPGDEVYVLGGSIARLLPALLLAPWFSKMRKKHVRLVVLKPNKDLALMNELFSAGKLKPVIDGPYSLGEVPEALRRFGEGRHLGKIVIEMAQTAAQ